MSVEIYGGRFLRGHATKVAVEAFQSAFGALITRIEPNAFMLELEGAMKTPTHSACRDPSRTGGYTRRCLKSPE